MLSLPPVKYPRRRGRAKASATVAPAPAALILVGVEDVEVIEPDLVMHLIFDTTGANPLSDVGAAVPGKWSARYGGTRYLGFAIFPIEFDTLYLQLVPTGPEAGANELSYANAPSDISDSLGRFLAAFDGFPLP